MLDDIVIILFSWFVLAAFIYSVGMLFLDEDSKARIIKLRESSNALQKLNLSLFSVFPIEIGKIIAALTLIPFICFFVLVAVSGIRPNLPLIILLLLFSINTTLVNFAASWLSKYSKNPKLDISTFGYDRGLLFVLTAGIPKMAFMCFHILFNLFCLLELYRIVLLIKAN